MGPRPAGGKKGVPWGLLNLATGAVFLVFGNSAETSDFWADCLWLWFRLDNGPNCASNRRQWIKRLIDFADSTGLEIHLLHYPPYHSKYNPVERVWGILERHWNGTLLIDLQTAMSWAATMTWKGQHPEVLSLDKAYQKGATVSDKEWRLLHARLERSPTLPKWDVVIKPMSHAG
jgi:hypothetical protein